MTLIDIKNALLTHFLIHSVFTVPDDLGVVKMDQREAGDMLQCKADVVRYALDELVALNIVGQVKAGVYVLKQSLNQLSQNVVVTPITALMVADLVNGFTKQTGEQKETGYVVNKLALTDYDIATLCRICHTVLGTDEEEDEPEVGRDQRRGPGKG